MVPLSDKCKVFVSLTEINTITNEPGQNKSRTEKKQAIVMEQEWGEVLCAYCVMSGSGLACLWMSFTLTTMF